MPAKCGRPFVKSNKSGYVDAEAIAEAVQRPTMRFVPIKNETQLDLPAELRHAPPVIVSDILCLLSRIGVTSWK